MKSLGKTGSGKIGAFIPQYLYRFGTRLESCSQHFIFFLTYEWAPKARVLAAGKPFQPSVIMQHSSLLGRNVFFTAPTVGTILASSFRHRRKKILMKSVNSSWRISCQVKNKIQKPGVVLTTLHFLCNL
jgi:hypothetical protein